jgi:hypothetical protein
MPGLAAWLPPPLEGTPRLAFSWAHARRKFYDIHAATKSPLAQEALTQIAALYAIEAEMRGQPALVRQQCSRPLVEAMNGWLRQQRIVSGQVSAHPAMARASPDRLADITNWTVSSTEARLAFAVLTTDRKAA